MKILIWCLVAASAVAQAGTWKGRVVIDVLKNDQDGWSTELQTETGDIPGFAFEVALRATTSYLNLMPDAALEYESVGNSVTTAWNLEPAEAAHSIEYTVHAHVEGETVDAEELDPAEQPFVLMKSFYRNEQEIRMRAGFIGSLTCLARTRFKSQTYEYDHAYDIERSCTGRSPGFGYLVPGRERHRISARRDFPVVPRRFERVLAKSALRIATSGELSLHGNWIYCRRLDGFRVWFGTWMEIRGPGGQLLDKGVISAEMFPVSQLVRAGDPEPYGYSFVNTKDGEDELSTHIGYPLAETGS